MFLLLSLKRFEVIIEGGYTISVEDIASEGNQRHIRLVDGPLGGWKIDKKRRILLS